MEKWITSEEIRESIFNTAGGKSPRLDGFPIEFYRLFLPKLIQPLCNMFNYAIETEKLPDTLEQALITVLLKPVGKHFTVRSTTPAVLDVWGFRLGFCTAL